MAQETVKEMLKMIDAKINHIEDMTADHRSIIVKLVSQSNSIVKFLAQLEVDEVTGTGDELSELSELQGGGTDEPRDIKMRNLKELVDEFKERSSELTELEEELEKHKDQINPGQVGDA